MDYRIPLSFFLFLLPFVVVYGANAIWPSSERDGQCVKFRPAGGSYATAWSFLLFLFAWAWVSVLWRNTPGQSVVISALFVLLLTTLVLWQKNYHTKDKREGVTAFIWVLFFLCQAILYTYSTGNHWSSVLLLPLLVWTVFQTAVNASELKCRGRA